MIRKYLKPYRLRIFLGGGIKFLGSVTELFLPYLLAGLIDKAVPSHNIQAIYKYGGLMAAASIICWLSNIIANRMASWTAAQAAKKIRTDLFSRIMFLSVHQIDEFTVPSLESRLTSDTYNVHRFMAVIQRMGIRAPMLFSGGIFFCFIQNLKLAFILLMLLPPIMLITFMFSKKIFPLFKNVQLKLDVMTRIVRENISGIRIIKAMDKTYEETKRFKKSSDDVSDAETRAAVLAAKTNPLINLILNLGIVMVILTGAFMINKGDLQTGVLMSFLSYFIQIANSLLAFNRMFAVYNKAASSSFRIAEVLNAPYESVIGNAVLKADENIPLLKFENVSFTYDKSERTERASLSDISFSLDKGKILGIIGATGSGKSTLIKLIEGLYFPDKGKIFWKGKEINTENISKVRQNISAVFQNDFLYSASFSDNITLGRDITISEIENAVKTAQAFDFITKKGGLEYNLSSKASDLSGGQRQRLLLARALAGPCELLILDDATSALDYETDAKFRKELKGYFKNKNLAIIIAAQRISSIKHADIILVLRDGKIIASGNHLKLLRECSLYSEIYENQMGSLII